MESVQATAKARQGQHGRLLHILGVGFGIAVTIGGTIGVGILRTPGTVASQFGNVWLIIMIWMLGGIYALLGTISVTELSTMLPRAGGWYVYARRAFGDYGGFVVGWSNWISFCTGLASVAIAFSEYSAALAPVPSGSVRAIAITTLILLSLLQWMGLQFGSRAQKVTSFLQAGAFVALIAACFTFGGNDPSASSEQTIPSLPSTASAMFIAVVIALQSVIFTYDGWYGAIYFAEEDSNPARNLPRSMISGVLMVIGIYMLLNIALLHVLPLPQLAASPLAAADAARVIFGGLGSEIITAISLVSVLSVMNAIILQTTRIMFALGRDGLFSSKAAMVNKGGTPSVALLLTSLTAILLVAIGTFDKLLAITTFFWVVMYGSGFVSLLVLRKREPELPRPFKAWGYPWSTVTVLVLSVIFLIGVVINDTTNSANALGLLAISYPVYLIVTRSRRGSAEARQSR